MGTFKSYNEIADKQDKSPDAGPYEAYGGGKSHDHWGKKFFHNLPLETSDSFHVAIVTPVIHYCMGGIHGNNRLGGNSLLDCVVFGRVSGRSAARYLSAANIRYVEASSAGTSTQSKL